MPNINILYCQPYTLYHDLKNNSKNKKIYIFYLQTIYLINNEFRIAVFRRRTNHKNSLTNLKFRQIDRERELAFYRSWQRDPLYLINGMLYEGNYQLKIL